MGIAFKARVEDPSVASYRYRVQKPIAFLTARGHEAGLYRDEGFDGYRTVVFSKAYKAEDQALALRLRQAGKRVVFDLCDDHFFNPQDLPKYRDARRDLLAMIGIADAVICSTPALARTVQQEAGLPAAPAVAPDAFEQAEAPVGPPTPAGQPARLLWFGRHGSPNAPAGLGDVLLIRDRLAQAFALRAFELVICSDSPERFEALFAGFPVPVRYRAWTPEAFAEELAATDAVLIPLSHNRFVGAKTHNRLSLALSAGAPVVADSIDSYAEFAPFAYLDDWKGGLEAVLLRPEEARARAGTAKAYLQARWSEPVVAPLWEAALGLQPPKPQPGRVLVKTAADVPRFAAWLKRERRSDRPWVLAGPEADTVTVARRKAEGALVMSLGLAAGRLEVDVACVLDVELLAEAQATLADRARWLLVPRDLHSRGWAAGRDLAGWMADLPVLGRLQAQERLLCFDLWTGGEGTPAALEGPDVPLRLLAEGGVREVASLGLSAPAAPISGLSELTSVLDRVTGGLAGVIEASRITYSAA